MRYDHLRQAGSVYCLGSCFHLSELNVPTSRFMKAWTTKRMFTHDQHALFVVPKSRKNSEAPPSIKELPCMRTPRRDHQTSRAHNNANYTKWEEKKQLLEHWRSVYAPYLFSIAFSGSKPPAWVKRCASRRPNDEFLDTNLIFRAWLWLGRWLAQETKWLIHLYPLPRSNSFQRRLHWRYRGFGRAWALGLYTCRKVVHSAAVSVWSQLALSKLRDHFDVLWIQCWTTFCQIWIFYFCCVVLINKSSSKKNNNSIT